MTFANDTFTDTDGVTLPAHTPDGGGTWTYHPNSTSSPAVIIASNRARCNRAGDNIVYHSATPATADYDVEADLVFLTAVASTIAGVFGRCNTAAKTNYWFGYQISDLKWHIFKNVAGVFTDLGSLAASLVANQSYHLKLQMRGSAIQGYVDGVLTVSVTDSAITAVGKAGVWVQGLLTNATGMALDNFVATDAIIQSVTPSPASLQTNTTGNVVTLTGVNTAWTAGTPGTPTFTLSGGTGASITAQSVASATSATITITAGTAAGTLTITDPSTGATCTIAVVVPSTTIAVNDANLFLSPNNWRMNGATYIETTCNGAYVKLVFTGTTALSLNFDFTPLTGAGISTALYPKIAWSIDGGAQQVAQPSSGATSLATGLSTGGTHTLELWMRNSNQGKDRWTTPAEVVRLVSFTIDLGGATLPIAGTSIALRTKRAMFLGDSITEGVESVGTNSGDANSNDSVNTWVRYVAQALDCEYAQVGYGFQGYRHAGNGNVPKLITSYKNQSNGVARTTSGFDYVIVNMGENDIAANSATLLQADVTGWLTDARTAFGASCKFFVLVPFSQVNQATIAAAVTTQQATDKGVYLVDLGASWSRGLTTPGTATAQSADGQHPNVGAHASLGAALARTIQNLLTPYSSSGGGGGGRMGLGL